MRKSMVLGYLFILLVAGCTPMTIATEPASKPPDATATVVAENPPACAGAKMIYHFRLHEMLLTGCVPSSVKEDNPTVIWGWNGENWRKVTEGGPLMRVLGGAAYDEKRNIVVLYGG